MRNGGEQKGRGDSGFHGRGSLSNLKPGGDRILT
jgi:hypothetical protein